MGNGLHERYYYCINIVYISAILWGYVLIWYSCGAGCNAFSVYDTPNAVEELKQPRYNEPMI